MKAPQRTADRADEFIRPSLDGGEEIVATLGMARSGMSPYLMGLFGVIGLLLGSVKDYSLVATTNRVFLIKRSAWSGHPKSIEATYDRGTVKVLSYSPNTVWGKLELALGSTTKKLYVHRVVRSQVDAITKALSTDSSPAAPKES